MKTTSNLFSIGGFDFGAGAMKATMAGTGIQMLAHVAHNGGSTIDQSAFGFKAKDAPLRIRSDFGSFYVGEGAHQWGRPVELLDFGRFTGSPEMRAMFYGTLTHLFDVYPEAANNPLTCVVGLPQGIALGEDGRANIDAARNWLKGEHDWRSDTQNYHVNIANVVMTSQARGAYVDAVVGNDGTINKALKRGEVGIVSIGSSTIETLVLNNAEPVPKYTSSVPLGVRRLLELSNTQRLYSLGELDIALRAGQLDTTATLPIWAREVTGHIAGVWGDTWKRFSGVIVVGGGRILLQDQLAKLFGGKLMACDQPIYSISRGLWKLGTSTAK